MFTDATPEDGGSFSLANAKSAEENLARMSVSPARQSHTTLWSLRRSEPK
jgi:hypothetical protein